MLPPTYTSTEEPYGLETPPRRVRARLAVDRIAHPPSTGMDTLTQLFVILLGLVGWISLPALLGRSAGTSDA